MTAKIMLAQVVPSQVIDGISLHISRYNLCIYLYVWLYNSI